MENPAETIYSRYGPSVVAIWASGGKTQGSIGAGSLISQDGLVVTKEKDARKYRFETHKRPYDYNDLTKVEEELEDMMKEMRGGNPVTFWQLTLYFCGSTEVKAVCPPFCESYAIML